MKRLIAPLIALAAFLLTAELGTGALASLAISDVLAKRVATGVEVGGWLAGMFLAVRISALTVQLRMRRDGREPPRLLLDLLAAIVVVVGLSLMSVVVFEVAPSAAFTTSGVMIAVVGFAVRHMVADLFYGITLALERPFEIGDWVQLKDGVTGRVEDLTWRAVELVTANNQKVIVPNNVLSTEQLINYDQPEPAWRTSLTITIGYEVPTEEVRRILLSAVQQVPESTRIPHDADARIIAYEESGVVWELRFWVPDFPSSATVSQHVNEALLRSLFMAGVRVPRPREEVLVGRLEEERASESAVIHNWIERVDLFRPLPHQDRADLQNRARRVDVALGGEVVREDEPGDSLFVIHEGAFDVLVAGATGGRRVETLGPGDVFGEMSLLTGAPRSATVVSTVAAVVHEITKADLEPCLRQHPNLALALASIVTERQAADFARTNGEADDGSAARRSTGQLIQRIRAFFKLPEVA